MTLSNYWGTLDRQYCSYIAASFDFRTLDAQGFARHEPTHLNSVFHNYSLVRLRHAFSLLRTPPPLLQFIGTLAFLVEQLYLPRCRCLKYNLPIAVAVRESS